MNYLKTFFSCVIAQWLMTNTYAEEENGGRDLSGYEPSYFVYAMDDENHIEFKVSIKYPMIEMRDGRDILYFAYTGKYDFYVTSDDPSRDSSPVISRLQNPGLFVKHIIDASDESGIKYVTAGWFHESNGQQISDNATFINTPNASDYVSRGWDYLGFDIKYTQNQPWSLNGAMNYYARMRIIIDCQAFCLIDDKEDDIRIFGGTEQADIRDYDGLRLIARYDKVPLSIGMTVRTGISDGDALGNASYQIDLIYRVLNIPVTLFYFNGYGKEISTYHIKEDYVGIGFQFW
jgi:outer membrane phospholipase A